MTPASRFLFFSTLLAMASVLQAGPPALTIDTQVQGEGEVLLDPSGPYKRNNVVTVTALPGDGYVFDHWEGDLAGDLNPTTLRVSGDHVVTAVFLTDDGGGDPGGGDPGGGGPAGGGTSGGIHPEPLPNSGLLVGYFTSWSVYRRAYYPGTSYPATLPWNWT